MLGKEKVKWEEFGVVRKGLFGKFLFWGDDKVQFPIILLVSLHKMLYAVLHLVMCVILHLPVSLHKMLSTITLLTTKKVYIILYKFYFAFNRITHIYIYITNFFDIWFSM